MKLFAAIIVLLAGIGLAGNASAFMLQAMSEEETAYFDCVQTSLGSDRTSQAILNRYLATRKAQNGFSSYQVPSGAKTLWHNVYRKTIEPKCGSASRNFVKFGCLPQAVDDGADAAAMMTRYSGVRMDIKLVSFNEEKGGL